MPWQITIIAHILLSSSRSIINRKIGLYRRDLSSYALVVSFVCVFAAGALYATISNQAVQFNDVKSLWLNFAAGGALFASTNLILLKLYRYIPASIGVFIGLLSTVSIVIFASIFADETLKAQHWIGASIISLVILMVAMNVKAKSKNSNTNIAVGATLAVIVSLMIGPAIVNEKYLIDKVGLETYLLFGWGAQAILAFIIAYAHSRSVKNKSPITIKMHKLVWSYGGLLGLAGLAFVLSLKNSGSSSLTAISASTKAVLTVFLAYYFLKEREHLALKLFALVGSTVGLVFLFS